MVLLTNQQKYGIARSSAEQNGTTTSALQGSMQKLKGTGTTFSTSGRPWLPFKLNPKVGARAARLHRLMRTGKIAPMSKAEMRELAAKAVLK